MIIREIKQDPVKILTQFDWFNDFNDTRCWSLTNYPEVIPILDAMHVVYLVEKRKELLRNCTCKGKRWQFEGDLYCYHCDKVIPDSEDQPANKPNPCKDLIYLDTHREVY